MNIALGDVFAAVFVRVLLSLSKEVFERRTSTASRLFLFTGGGFAQIFEQVVSIIVKKLSNTNFVASRHFKMRNTSLPVDVRCLKKSLILSCLILAFLKAPQRQKETGKGRIFLTDLVWSAEDMCIILLESPDTGQSSQRARQLITMKNPKVCHPQGKFTPWTRTVIKHNAGTTTTTTIPELTNKSNVLLGLNLSKKETQPSCKGVC